MIATMIVNGLAGDFAWFWVPAMDKSSSSEVKSNSIFDDSSMTIPAL
jgi:hypothetical protein